MANTDPFGTAPAYFGEQAEALIRFRAAQEEWGAAMQQCAQVGLTAEQAFASIGMELPPVAAVMFTEMFAALAETDPSL